MAENMKNLDSSCHSIAQPCYDKLLPDLEAQIQVKLSGLKSYIENGMQNVDIQVEFLLDEMELRIESLKNQLNDYHDKFRTNLASIKQTMFVFENQKMEKARATLSQFEEPNNEAKAKINNEVKFYQLQNKLKNLNVKLNELDEFTQKVQINSIQEDLDERIIGRLVYTNSIESKIRMMLTANEFDFIETPLNPFTVCELPNKKLLAVEVEVDAEEAVLKCYNEDLKKFTLINAKSVHYPFDIAINEDGQTYISDKYANVSLFDIRFQLLKNYGRSPGSSILKLKIPKGISYKNGLLFICDSLDQKIVILNKELKYKKSINLDYSPQQIKVTDYCVCILSEEFLYFYETDFKLKHQYKFTNEFRSRVFEIDSYFYQFTSKPDEIHCYDIYGILLHKFSIQHRFRLPHFDFGSFLFIHKQQLYLKHGPFKVRLAKQSTGSAPKLAKQIGKLKRFNFSCCGFYPLPNEDILISTKDSIEIYDKDLKMKKIVKADHRKCYFTLNPLGEVFVLDTEFVSISVFDKDLEFKRIVKLPFTRVNRISHYKDHFYITDTENQRMIVIKLEHDRFHHWTPEFDYAPKEIAVANSTACVSSITGEVFFHDVNSWYTKYRYNYGGIDYRIFTIKSRFYIVDPYKSKRIYCHDVDGVFIEEYRLWEFMSANTLATSDIGLRLLGVNLELVLFKRNDNK